MTNLFAVFVPLVLGISGFTWMFFFEIGRRKRKGIIVKNNFLLLLFSFCLHFQISKYGYKSQKGEQKVYDQIKFSEMECNVVDFMDL